MRHILERQNVSYCVLYGLNMRHFIYTAAALLAVITFSSFVAWDANAQKRTQLPALKNDHLTAPGNSRYAFHSDTNRFSRHHESSFRSRYRRRHKSRGFLGIGIGVGIGSGFGHGSGFGVGAGVGISKGSGKKSRFRGHRQRGHQQESRRAGKKYRNRTQFCRRAWEVVEGREVVVRRCVWVHNRVLRRHNKH